MSREQRALVRHLFSEITTTLEIAHSLGIEGQHPGLKSQHARDIAQRIVKIIDNATCLAAAVGALSAQAGGHEDIPGPRSGAPRKRHRISRTL